MCVNLESNFSLMAFLGIYLISQFCMTLSIKLIVPEVESVSVREYEIFSRVKYL